MPKFTGRSIQSKRNQHRLQKLQKRKASDPKQNKEKKNGSERLVGGGSHPSSNFEKKILNYRLVS